MLLNKLRFFISTLFNTSLSAVVVVFSREAAPRYNAGGGCLVFILLPVAAFYALHTFL